MLTRRNLLALLGSTTLAATSLPLTGRAARAQGGRPALQVLAAPGCGCCHTWADLAEDRGHAVTVEDLTDSDAQKAALGVPVQLASCHTVLADGYVFEGHVPFEAMDAVLRDRPRITGLTVPGMPMGAPGMGDDPSARFDVIAFGGTAGNGQLFYRAGTSSPFAI